MKVALIQITVGSNFDENFEKSKKFLQDSLNSSPDFILLPECFLFLSSKSKILIEMNHDFIKYFKNFSKINNVYLLLGSIPITENDKLFNRSILINHKLTGKHSITYRAHQLGLNIETFQIQAITQAIKSLADRNKVTLENVDEILFSYHKNIG